PSTYGTSLKFRATVTKNGGGGDPTCGSVEFFRAGTISLGTVSLSTNTADLTIGALPAVVNSITAVYTPASSGCSFTASTASALSQTVGKAGLTVTADDKAKTYGG